MGNIEIKSRIIPDTIDRLRSSMRKDPPKTVTEENTRNGNQNDSGLLQQLRSNAICVEEDIGEEQEEKDQLGATMATDCVESRQDQVPASHDPHAVSLSSNNTFPEHTTTTREDSSSCANSSMLADKSDVGENVAAAVLNSESNKSERTDSRTMVSPGLNHTGPNHASGSAFITAHDKVKQLKRKNTPASLPTVNKLNARDKMKACDLMNEEMLEEEEDAE